MRVKSAEKKVKRRGAARPFLVLPLLDDLEFKEEGMPKKTGLKLFTKTWSKGDAAKKEEDEQRPLTATLEKPTILDVRLIGLIDMSVVRKEFLNISNICRFPLNVTINKRKQTATISRPLSLPTTAKFKSKKTKRPETSEDSWEEESSSIQSARKSRIPKGATKNSNLENLNEKTKKSGINDANNNNYKTFRIPRKRNVTKLLEVKSDLGKSTKLPEPCKTCGRPDQPERFHSHPVTPMKPAKRIEEPPKMKSTVQKPVAMKYKSKQSAEKRPLPPPQRKPSLPAQKLVHTPPNIGSSSSEVQTQKTPRARSAKRTLTCYLCGREFGTASLSLHEPKCLERWRRENEDLPSHLRRQPPKKPDHPMDSEEWNKFAWESSQDTLIPCSNCGRTFFPDRLVVHQKSCKIINDSVRMFLEHLHGFEISTIYIAPKRTVLVLDFIKRRNP